MNRQNYFLHLQGYYNMEAFGVVLSNAFSKNSKAKYPEEPIRIFELTEREKEERAEMERGKAIAFFTSLETNFNSNQNI